MAFKPPPEHQTGNKYTPKFRSVTTPGKALYLMDAITEFVMMQIYGMDLPEYFWRKTVNKKLSAEYKKTKNKLYAMIKRNENISALKLLGVVFDKLPDKEKTPIKEPEKEETMLEESSNVYEIENKIPITKGKIGALKALKEKVDGQKKEN